MTNDPLKTRIPGSAVGFEKKITKQGMRKIIRTTRVNGEMIDSNKLRDELIGLVKKAGTKGLSGKQLEKKLRENYKMDIKDRERVIKGITKHWAKPEEGLTKEQRLRIKRLNVAAYSVDRDKEYGIAGSLKNKRSGKSGILQGSLTAGGKGEEKITGKRLGVEAAGAGSSVSVLGGILKSGATDNYNKSGFAGGNKKTTPVTGGLGPKPVAPIGSLSLIHI